MTPKSRSEVGEEIITERIRLEERKRIEKWAKKRIQEEKSAKPADEVEEIDERAYSAAITDLLTFLSNPK